MGFLAVFEHMAVVPCQDPRNLPLHLGDIKPQTHGSGSGPLLPDENVFIKEGHYMLYKTGNTSFDT